MTLIDKVFEYIREHPTDTPSQIGQELGVGRNVVSAYLCKLKNGGYITEKYTDGVKEHIILKNRKYLIDSQELDIILEQTNYKKEIYQKMLDVYLKDFESAIGFNDRVEIGKLILRLLEKI